MSGSHFWLTEAQFERIARHLSTDMRGVARVDDRRVISGIIQALRSGRRWKDAPATYGPHKTLSNRFVRWRAKGVWSALFQSLAQVGDPPAEGLIGRSAVRAHRSAVAGKGGSAAKPSGDPAPAAAPRSTLYPFDGKANRRRPLRQRSRDLL